MRAIPRIDCHHHLWRPSLYSYPWLQPDAQRPTDIFPDLAPIAGDYWLNEYLQDVQAAGVVKSVHLDSGYVPTDPVGETRLLQNLADKYGFPHGIVARAALEQPDIQANLEAQTQYPNIRGVRHILNWHPDPAKRFTSRGDWMQDRHWLNGFALLARYNLSFDLQIWPQQMPAAAALVRRFPETSVILNHGGMPLWRDAQGWRVWQKGIRQLAAYDNVTVKISGPGMVFPHWTTEEIRPWIEEIIEVFGINRVMFASNFPVDKLYGGLIKLYQAFDTITANLSDSEARAVFYHNAARVYRLG
ncbi:amidohydrolase family protein [Martelella alba]|uniref:Amidohydrolase-related domain-containing protein n=1 Tax=Martelella alba TaxID=2590451 RepID=A0ABY2SPI5_9HYPH|nr:amidohydrolase family protein [Martelella alba]TKI07883.1 hypothetical protein FCN80_05460 [Martelella alba]